MRLRLLAAAFGCALALPAAPAHAAVPNAVLVTGAGFAPSEVTLVQGGTLTLASADFRQPHDLVSLDRVPRTGAYLFRSTIIDGGQVADVTGVSALAPSVYPFYCSVHEWMTGNITVVSGS